MTSIVEVIQHYQRSIDNSQNNEARLLHCINKLYNLPIKVEHLQETGVGKTVNSLRKFNGEIGVAAKTLVTKWKAMVAAEEEPMDTTSQTNESEQHNDSNGDDDEANTPQHDDVADENHNRNINSQQQEENKHRSKEKKDKHKDKHKERSSSSGHKEHSKHSSSSSSKHSSESKSEKHKSTSSSSSSKDKESHHKENSSSSKHKDKEREKEKIEHKSSKDKSKDQDRDKEKERSDKKREEKEKSKTDKEHSSSHKSGSSSSSKSKHEDKHSSSGHSSTSSSKEKERSEKHKSSSKDKERTKDQEKLSSSSTSSSKDKPEHKTPSTSSTSKSSAKDSDSAERKRRHNSDNDSSDFKSPQPKVAKVVQKSSTSTPASKAESSPTQADEDAADDSFDSSMGANFDDVLGMLNVPLKKSKKSLKSPSTPTANNSSSSSKKDRPTSSSSSNSTPVTSSSSGKVNGTRVPFSSNNSSLYSTPSSSKISTMKPDLLAPTAKLEPLDPSIALELPTISTNYKPMPLNQTVMDCVFNNSSSKPVRTLTDAEAYQHGISSKTMRTKIYSGVRTGQTYQVPSLFDMCIRILQKNIDALEYTGGVPFEVLKPVLERATPQQLYVFEDYNPYLMEDSDILWQQHVSRTYRTKKRLENESWREMFIRCQEEEERRLSVLKDSIKASQKIAAAPVRKTQLAFVDSMVKPPRNVAKKQEQFGTKSKMIATPAARVAALSNVTPNAARVGDQRLRVPSTARDHAQVSNSSIRPKKAPLMQKTLQFIRGRHKR